MKEQIEIFKGDQMAKAILVEAQTGHRVAYIDSQGYAVFAPLAPGEKWNREE